MEYRVRDSNRREGSPVSFDTEAGKTFVKIGGEMADRRMLWKNISTSRKINKISCKAALLYTWVIPWLDVKGYIEAEADSLKDHVFPKRKEIEEEEVKTLADEIFSAGAWIEYQTEDGKRVAFDPKFKDFQNIREDHESKSIFCGKVKLRPTKDIPTTHPLQTNYGEDKIKSDKVKSDKVKEVKERECEGKPKGKPAWLNPEPEKPSTPNLAKHDDAFLETYSKKLHVLQNRILSKYGHDFNFEAFIRNNLQANKDSIILSLERLLESPKEISNPEAYCQRIVNVESGNFNEREAIKKHEEIKQVGEILAKNFFRGNL